MLYHYYKFTQWMILMRMIASLITIVVILFLQLAPAQANEIKRTIKIGYANEWAPISVGDGKNIKGILPDLMDEIIDKNIGITVEHIGLPWGRAQALVESGDIDGFITTPTKARLQYAIRSKENVIYIPFQAFVKKNSVTETKFKLSSSLNELKNLNYCDVLGNGWAQSFYNKHNIKFDQVPSIDNCVKMMIAGRSDVIIHASPVVQLFIKKLAVDGKVSIVSSPYPDSPSFPLLLSKKSSFKQDFLNKFDDAVSKMKGDQIYTSLLNRLTDKNIDAFLTK